MIQTSFDMLTISKIFQSSLPRWSVGLNFMEPRVQELDSDLNAHTGKESKGGFVNSETRFQQGFRSVIVHSNAIGSTDQDEIIKNTK